MKWAAAAGGGKVLQVVAGSTTTQVDNSTDTFSDTGLTASITPSSTASKILVIAVQNGMRKSDGNSGNRIDLRLMRGATEIASVKDHFWTGTALFQTGSTSLAWLDSPNTTSSTTYKTQFRNAINAATVTVQVASLATSTIILMEIGA